MEKLISLLMYPLWVISILVILAATFTNFQYEDLNILAIILFVSACLNSFFIISKK
ncbi:MAG: hypothetical protein AB1650_03065 [Candidatus Omnitrophota bacterium]